MFVQVTKGYVCNGAIDYNPTEVVRPGDIQAFGAVQVVITSTIAAGGDLFRLLDENGDVVALPLQSLGAGNAWVLSARMLAGAECINRARVYFLKGNP